MESKRNMQLAFVLAWAAMGALVINPVMSQLNFEDQKNYFSPDPNARPPPTVSYSPPSYGSGGGPSTPTPPANCGKPPSGGHHHHNPSPPLGGSSGGYYNSPPPSTPTSPNTPTTPGVTIPSPPFAFDPNSPPFNCTYWKTHPKLILGMLGWWGTVGSVFGIPSLPGFGSHTNLLQALSNTRTDGLGELYREGTAALLNSMAHAKFTYTTPQVRDSFVAAALGSNKAASAQAYLFKLANEGTTKPRA